MLCTLFRCIPVLFALLPYVSVLLLGALLQLSRTFVMDAILIRWMSSELAKGVEIVPVSQVMQVCPAQSWQTTYPMSSLW